jgi:aspartate racemase
MPKIGLVGGLTWHSSLLYFKRLNEIYADQNGEHASCPLVLYNFDFQQIIALQRKNDWAQLGQLVYDAIVSLAAAGATSVAICSNTMHRAIAFFPLPCPIPLVHMGSCLGAYCTSQGYKTVGFLGTRFAMNDRDYLASISHSNSTESKIEILLPSKPNRVHIDRIIFEELTKGCVLDSSKIVYEDAIAELKSRGAEAVILGCTEICLLINGVSHGVPLVDSLEVHCHWMALHELDK